MAYKGIGAKTSHGVALALHLTRQQPQQHGHTGSYILDKILNVGEPTDHQQKQPHSTVTSSLMSGF